MNIYWQHSTNNQPSPRYESPDLLLRHTDQYFADYCFRTDAPNMCVKTIGYRACEPTYRLINHYQNRHVIHWIINGEGWCNNIPVGPGSVIYFKSHVPYSFSSNPTNPCNFAWITFEGNSINNYLEHL